MMRSFLFTTCLLCGFSALAQSDSATATSVQSMYAARGIELDHVTKMVELVTRTSRPIPEQLLLDFLNTIEGIQPNATSHAVPEVWQNHWMNTYHLEANQAQDLYKIAGRFAHLSDRNPSN